MTIEFDSTAGTQAFGRIAWWFAGDLGLSPTLFGRVHAEVTPTGATNLTIPFARAGAPPMSIEGTLTGDTLRIRAARQGAEPGPFATTAGAAFVRRTP